jgi:predicted NAD/FAD-dependent oxidoreductase
MTDGTRAAGAPRCAVIGAGISGLTAARELARAGCTVVVFERGRGPGGRASRRRAEGFAFDHGAQYFTARGEAFIEQTHRWVEAGVAAQWQPRMATAGAGRLTAKSSRTTRYVGTPGMSALARDLGAGLDIRTGTRIAAVRPADRAVGPPWTVEPAGEGPGAGNASRAGAGNASRAGAAAGSERFDAVLLACTPAQGLPLLAARPAFTDRAAAVRFLPVWAAMLGFGEDPVPGADGIFIDHPALSWAARDDSKPGRRPAGGAAPEGAGSAGAGATPSGAAGGAGLPGGTEGGGTGAAWVLHADGQWSRGREEEPPQVVLAALVGAFEEATGAALPTRAFEAAHRWRYARPENPLGEGALWDAHLGIGMCGDWCASARIEGAYESGRAAAEHIIASG